MLTGVASPVNGVREYFDPLPPHSLTVAHRLQAMGYATGFFGKWHLGIRDRTAPLVGEVHARTVVPSDSRGGFEFWEGFESGFLLNDPWLHGTRLPQPVCCRGYQSDVLCDRAAEWIDRPEPWFCLVSLESPHPPYDAPSGDVPRRAVESLVLAPNVPPDAAMKARSELAGYYAHLEATDRAIGRLVRSLEATRTLVVVTSVHGDMHGAHGLFRKGWPYEESIRVPLLVRVPGEDPRRDESAVSLVDLPGLMLATLGQRGMKIANRPARISMPSVVALPLQGDRIWRGLRSARRKLVLNDDGSPWLYFDLERDAWENENLVASAAYAAEIAAWRALI
jgi:arylsulfatase A-like enzyme